MIPVEKNREVSTNFVIPLDQAFEDDKQPKPNTFARLATIRFGVQIAII